MDEYLIDFADNHIDTSDFYRRYMAGFVISNHENLITHCGVNYTRNVNMSSSTLFDPVDTKDLMCLMLGFTPIVESNPLFTNTLSRKSLISGLSRNEICFANSEDVSYLDITGCMFHNLVDAYRLNSTVKYPLCNNISFTDDYTFIVDRNAVRNVTNISSGSFRVDGAVRLVSDFSLAYDESDSFISRQFAPLLETVGVTIYYNNQVTN